MSQQLFTGLGSLIPGDTPSTDHWVLCQGHRLLERGSGTPPRDFTGPTQHLAGAYLTPRFTDIHNHGGGGTAFEEAPLIDSALETHRQAGTGQLIASLVTNPLPQLTHTLSQLAHKIQDQPQDQRTLVGIHLEGPYLSPAHKGAHNPDFLTSPTPTQAEELIASAEGHLKQITIAPETDRDLEAIATFVERGVAVAIGHTDADYALAKEAFDAGASLLTHTFNAMRPLLHREPGPIAAALDSPQVTLELICDGVHVHAPTMRTLWQAAPGRIALITDAMAAAGCADGHYMLGSLDVDVKNSVARLREGGAIAGSTLTLARAVETAVASGIPLAEAVAASTTIPARALGLDQPGGLNILSGQGKLLATLA